MPRPELSKNSKYWIPANLYKQCVYFCRQYPDWEMELRMSGDPSAAITYDKPHVQTSGDYDATSTTAMRRYMIAKKKQLVDDIIVEVCKDVPMMGKWLLVGMTTDTNYFQLRENGMPYGKNQYYLLRRKFLLELSKRI